MEDKKAELKALLEEIEAETGADNAPEVKAEEVASTTTVEKLMEQLGDKLVNAVVAAGASAKDANATKEAILGDNMKAVQYPADKDLKDLDDDQVIVTWFKSLVNKEDSVDASRVFKALTEGTAADGGNLVPTPLAAEIWRVLPDLSVMRKIARTIPMTSLTIKLNSLTARPVAYWTNEYASKTTTSAEFSQVTLTAYKLVALLPASHELIEDANIDLVRYIVELFAESIAIEEDKAFFTGSGTGQPKGITQETISSQSVGASVDFDDIIDLMDLVPSAVKTSNSSAFVAHKRVIRLLKKIKDSDGDYIWRQGGKMDGQMARLPDTIYGYPIYEQNDLSENELYFGDWKYYIIGDRRQITVDITNEGGEAWRRDGTEIKAVERVGGTAVMVRPFAKLTDV